MSASLDGRVAVVTGSTQGIGFAIAQRLLMEEATVIVHDRTLERARDAAGRLGGDSQVHAVAGDLESTEGVGAISLAVARLGRSVDIVVNCAGRIESGHLNDVPVPQIEHLMRLNAYNGLMLARAFFTDMLARDDHGRLLWISSEVALMPQPDMAAYSLSKSAQVPQLAFTPLWRRTTVTSNVVIVGPTRTEGAAEFIGGDDDAAAGWAGTRRRRSQAGRAQS